jgi:D-alanyl-lipoteichoic acid acyltransferase DltB (MBOAT superfamily)
MKVVLADGMLSGAADTVFGTAAPLLQIDAWLGVLAFSGQIFFDFAGYSACAIGIGLCLGFSLPQNFRYPYAAIGFSDFWRRWHISLSSWLRDYLYIPLGGNKKGNLRTYVNLMTTMLLGGLWHGASWTFVVWGGLHGSYLCIERLFRPAKLPEPVPVPVKIAGFVPAFLRTKTMNKFLLALITFFLINITWVFFRAQDFPTAWRILAAMFGRVENGAAVLSSLAVIKVSVVISCMIATHWFMRNTTVLEVAQRTKWWIVGIVWSLMLLALMLSQESGSSFIYFQF